jgi:hypothetical protein
MITLNGMEDGAQDWPPQPSRRSCGACSYYTYEKTKYVYITLNITDEEVC